MKKYTIEYGKSKASYTAAKLESVAREYGHYELEHGARDHDYLACAVDLFCATHFMWGGAAHLDSCDAQTRGDLFQDYQYQPNGAFRGWIHAITTED